MAEPVVDEAAFPGGLPKSKGKTARGTVKGSGIQKGNPVKVIGHRGKKPFVWTGTVGDPTAVKDTWAIAVTLKHPKQLAKDEKDQDTEDVSTTVTNSSDEESQPVNTAGVALVP